MVPNLCVSPGYVEYLIKTCVFLCQEDSEIVEAAILEMLQRLLGVSGLLWSHWGTGFNSLVLKCIWLRRAERMEYLDRIILCSPLNPQTRDKIVFPDFQVAVMPYACVEEGAL